ncbi:MAG: hypothetical protein AAF926_05555, partial [Pseudomonadota bacterium]
QSGNPKGRPKSARSKLSEAFIKALADDFADNGEAVIATLRAKKPEAYVAAVGKLIPREDTLTHEGGLTIVRRTFSDGSPDTQ